MPAGRPPNDRLAGRAKTGDKKQEREERGWEQGVSGEWGLSAY